MFAGFKSKVNLLELAVETSLVGDAESTPPRERTEMRDVHAGRGTAGGDRRRPARRSEIRDTIWTLNSPHLYDLLVRQRGWTPERYGDWIRTAFLALIAA